MGRMVIGFWVMVFAGSVFAGEPSLDDLSWMAGSWVQRSETKVSEEHWLLPAGGLMLGLNREVSAGGKAFFEYLRIEQREDGIYYLASPRGKPPTPFKLTELSAKRVVFENPEHDFPQKITYRLEEGKLCAAVEATVDGQTKGGGWCWQAAANLKDR